MASWPPTSRPTAKANGGKSPRKPVKSNYLGVYGDRDSLNSLVQTCILNRVCRSRLMELVFVYACVQVCVGAARAAGCGGSTTSGRTSSAATSPMTRRTSSSASTSSSATGSLGGSHA
jgi:hypothetical protein